MKYKILTLVLMAWSAALYSQQTINGSITHEGLERDYILYVPEGYTGDMPVPLVFNFHGYTSTAEEQMFYGDFRPIADTANFLLVHPQGTLLNGSTHWNVGGWTVGSTVDDVGFTAALIDSLSAEYNINPDRVYATGMSNGGFMSFLLACQLSDRFAAVASVTGSMTPETYDNCDPQHPTPVLQIHGTVDLVVPYIGAFFTRPVGDVIQYWVDYNHCNTSPVVTALPDVVTSDGSTVEHIVYDGGDNGATVEHFKVTGGGHTWPGTAFSGFGTNQDIDASLEIWKFFSRYDINGVLGLVATGEERDGVRILEVFPNPAGSWIQVRGDLQRSMPFDLYSSLGEHRMTGVLDAGDQRLDIAHLSPGIYFLQVGGMVCRVLKL